MDEQQFGRYSLLRRLSQDAFGSLYRAGLVANGGVAELVLLRTFDVPSSDQDEIRQRLANAVAGPGTPSLPAATDRGVIDGTAFLTYPYTSGRTMRDLLQELERRGTALPVEHCLFLVDSICKTGEAYARAVGSSGVVFPETVYLSNDGDIQILGRELAGETITSLASSMGLSDYLTPEAATSGVNDDVYAISALLHEMAGENAPSEVLDLVAQGHQSAADQRPSLETWRINLEQVMFSMPESSSAFNVAFFLYGLLINEIEEDTRRIETEKISLGAQPASATAGAVDPVVSSPASAHVVTVGSAKKRSGLPMPLILAAGVVALALLGYFGWSMFGPNSQDSADQTQSAAVDPLLKVETGVGVTPQINDANPTEVGAEIVAVDEESGDQGSSSANPENEASGPQPGTGTVGTSADSSAPTNANQPALSQPVVSTPATTRGPGSGVLMSSPQRYTKAASASGALGQDLPEPPPSDAELETQIQQLAAAKSAEVEASIRKEYESDLEELEKRLQEAQETQKRQEEERLAQVAADEEKKRLAAEAETARKAQEEKAAAEAASAAAAVELAKAKLGDLVTDGPGVTPATMTKRPEPVFPRMAQRLGRAATVNVRILVDENGRVADTQLISEKAGFGFDEAALAAAKKTEWKPASKDGVNVKIWRTVRIVFDPAN